MTDSDVIILEKQNGTGYITLNRPQALNAYNVKMRDELFEVLGAVRDDPDIEVIILKGAGEKAFCAGADLTEFLTAPSPIIARQVRFERNVWERFLSIDKPFIAALHGYVLGSGIEMALCCDIRLASEDACFGLPEPGLGIIPAAGGSQTLPRVVGTAVSLDMLMSGRWLTAKEAYKIKLVNRILSRESLLSEAEKLADKIKSHDSQAVRCAKQAITRGLDLTLAEGLNLEKTLLRRLMANRAGENA